MFIPSILTNKVFGASVFHRGEWTTSSNEGSPVGPFVEIVWLSFMKACGITQREHNRAFHMLGHLPDNLLREGLGLCRCPDKYMGLDMLHYRE
jgi:hypothetical protein